MTYRFLSLSHKYSGALASLRMLLLVLPSCALAQSATANVLQQQVFAGLRSVGAKGQVNAVATDTAGEIYLLLDQKDGVRILKVSNDGAAVLAQAQLGAAGDTGVALALDPSGNVYVTGTSNATSLNATSGAAIPSATAVTTNSFVAKFDANLNELFLTFTGGSRIAASAIAVSSDAVFVTGITYGSDLPVTSGGIQQVPAYGSSQNGFLERFSADGSTLVYATYVTGAQGDTTPTGIAVDAVDDAWLVGSTTATGFPTLAAVVPAMLSTPSGFLLRLMPAGDAFVFSTFVPGPGLSGIALDSTGEKLLITGAVSLSQFPVDSVLSVIVPTTYQVLLRMPLDGSSVESGTVIAPGLQSIVTAAQQGAAWVAGDFAAGVSPILPTPPLATVGTAYAVRVSSSSGIDQTIRFGGIAVQQQTFASVPLLVGGIAVDAAGELILGGAAQPTASSNLLSSETYDLPLRGAPTPAFPSSLTDAEVSPAACSGSLCGGSASYLAKVDLGSATAALTWSAGDLPAVTLRNLGSAAADNLQLSSSSGTLTTNCPAILPPGGECNLLLSGGLAGTLTASSSDASTSNVAFGSYAASSPENAIVFFPRELDFGVQTSSSAAAQTITISNLGSADQTFTTGLVTSPKTFSPFSEEASDCALAGSATTRILAAGATCHITVGFRPSPAAADDGFLQAEWTVGSRQVMLTGYSQAASLSASASEVDFGTEFRGGLILPRYLYLSNASLKPVAHVALGLPAGSPFTVTDGCGAMLAAGSVCRIRLNYLAASAPSTDSVTLVLDEGISVLLTGVTMPPQTAGGSSVNPSLTVSPLNATFGNAVPVTGASATTQTIGVTNSGASDFALSLSLTGDFTDATSCGPTLAAGATCAVAIHFAPSQPGPRQGLLTVTGGAGTAPVNVTLSGEGTAILAANNGTLVFGGVPVGQPQVQFYKVTQPFDSLTVSTTGPFRVTLVEDHGFGPGEPPSSDYVITGTGTCHNCWVAVRFQPVAAGPQSGTLTFSSNPQGLPYVLALTGSGVATSGLIATPSAQNFGSVPVHSSSGTLLFTLTNETAAGTSVTVSPPVTTGDYFIGSVPPGGRVCSGPLAYGASCFVQVSFAPMTAGVDDGTLTVATSAGTATVPLTGTGTSDPGLGISPLSLTFANLEGPSAITQQVALKNTGVSSIQIGTPTANTAAFSATTSCGVLVAGATCTVQVTFQPGSTPVSDILYIPATSASSNGTSVTRQYLVNLTGAYTSDGAGLQILPATANYGPAATVTEGPLRQFTITNQTSKMLTLTTRLPRDFVQVGTPCTVLQPASSCDFAVQFVPLTNGDIAGTISVEALPSDGSAPLKSIAYAEGFGVGSGALTVTGGLIVSGIYNFGQVALGQSAAHTFTLANNGPAGTPSITVRRVTSAPPFLSATTCGSPLAAGDTCSVTVTYAPTAGSSGGDVSSLTVESDAQSSPDVVNLAGASASPTGGTSPPLATFMLSQGSSTFAATTVGDTSAAQTVTLTNTGTATVHVAFATATPDFAVQNACMTVDPGTSCSITVSSTPQSAGTHLAALEIGSDATSSLDFVSLVAVGRAASLTFSPVALSFGAVQVGSNAVLPVLVTNTSTAAVSFASIMASGDYNAGGNCPSAGASLAPQTSCTVQVTFAPVTTGTRNGSLLFNTSASTSPLQVPLSGTGTSSQLVITPSSLNFGSIVVGASANLSVVLTDSGTAPVNRLIVTVSGDFAVTSPCPQATLAIGATCTLQVTFTPSAVGLRSGALTITSSDRGSPVSVPLTGTGVSNATFSLTVNGAASATVTIVSGEFATYAVAATPAGGFGGSVALTCTPLQTVPYASCSLLPSLLNLASGTADSAATVNTIYTGTGIASAAVRPLGSQRPTLLALLLPGLLLMMRRGRSVRRWVGQGFALTALFAALLATGCGGSKSSNIHYTPAGTYQFQVTANSTSGVQTTQTVLLNLVVTPR